MNFTKLLKNPAGFNTSPFKGKVVRAMGFAVHPKINMLHFNPIPTLTLPLKGRELFQYPLTVKISLLTALLIITTPSGADELGRLFFTPEQRTQLDYSYVREASPENNDRALTLNGIVQKRGGKRTVWINGVARQAGQSDERSPESLPVPIPGQSKSIKMKVGQKVLITPTASDQ